MAAEPRFELTAEIHIRREDVEKFISATKILTEKLELNKKTRVAIEYDPQKPSVNFQILKEPKTEKKPLKDKIFKYSAVRFVYNHFFRYILAIFPRLQYSEYGTPQTGEKWVAIWFSWLGHIFWQKHYLLDPKDRNF